MTYLCLLFVAFINFSYILMPVCLSIMQRNCHNDDDVEELRTALHCTTVSTAFTYVFLVHYSDAWVYYFASCCIIVVLCCVMLCFVVLCYIMLCCVSVLYCVVLIPLNGSSDYVHWHVNITSLLLLLQLVLGLFPGGKAAGAWHWPPTPSSPEVRERLGLYLYSPSGLSCPVLG